MRGGEQNTQDIFDDGKDFTLSRKGLCTVHLSEQLSCSLCSY